MDDLEDERDEAVEDVSRICDHDGDDDPASGKKRKRPATKVTHKPVIDCCHQGSSMCVAGARLEVVHSKHAQHGPLTCSLAPLLCDHDVFMC